MADIKTKYPVSNADTVALTITLGGLGSSSTFVAGRESAAVANDSNRDLDHLLSGKIKVGTSPSAGTFIQVWVIPAWKNASGTPSFPDVFDGTDSAETVTSVEILQACGRIAAEILVNATTSDRDYYFAPVSIARLFGGWLPSDYVVFVTHNTGVNLHATDGNHELHYQRVIAEAA